MFFEDIFIYSFLQRAFVAGTLIAILGPLLGVFLVTRRYSLLIDALSHIALLGVSVASVMKLPITLGAFVTSYSAGLGIEYFRKSTKSISDGLLALFLSGSLALSVVLLNSSYGKVAQVNVTSFLFGSLALVSWQDVFFLGMLLLLSIAFIINQYNALFLIALDEDLAKVSGVKIKTIQALFLFFVAVLVSLALQMVGALLIGALLVIPVLSAMQWQRGFLATIALAEVYSVLGMFFGLFMAHLWSLPSGGAVVLVLVGGFLATIGVQKIRRFF